MAVSIESALETLSSSERKRLCWLAARRPPIRIVLEQLERILASRTFSRVQPAARRFLTFVCAMKLLGKDNRVKETTIAMRVFYEGADYDSSQTSRIRVAAESRKRLEHYYANEGVCDIVSIKFESGTYVPVVTDRPAAVGVWPFEDWEASGQSAHLGRALAHELVLILQRDGRLHAAMVDSPTNPYRYQLRGAFGQTASSIIINGTC